MAGEPGRVDLYGPSYTRFASDLYGAIRSEAFGEDIGQTGWVTAGEQDMFLAWLGLRAGSRLLDLACGSGGPTLRIAQKTGCRVVGVDQHEAGIATATAEAARMGVSGRADFVTGDAASPLAFPDAGFDAVTCFDAINHLPDRKRVLLEWRRVLRPGGRLLFTDPIVLTGPISNREVAIRASIGFFLFVPPGIDEALLAETGFTVERVEDRTPNMASNAEGWFRARQRREVDLRAIEGDDGFEGQQRFLETAATLAAERRLSRLAILAVHDG
jgi:SAM-dependent methyltransferase